MAGRQYASAQPQCTVELRQEQRNCVYYSDTQVTATNASHSLGGGALAPGRPIDGLLTACLLEGSSHQAAA